MSPVETYSNFICDIESRKNKSKPTYLGVLFCDIEQYDVRSYITNYLEIHNKKSGLYMDFYIPGYVGQPEFDEKTEAHIGNKNYKFYRN